MIKMKVFTLALFTALCSTAFSQKWEDTVAKIQNIFARYQSTNPGAQLAISRQGKVIFSQAWGIADLEHNVALTTQSLIEAGSVSKQFTAAAVLLLEQAGKLKLEDDVHKYIPELPDYGYPISLRQLMQHTSGLKDWGSVAAIGGWPRSTKTYNNDDALYIASLQRTLNNKPGDEFIYSNTNYNLLAVIVERVSGLSLADYSDRYIFPAAGMRNTQWRANFKKVVSNRALAYAKNGATYLTDMPNEYVYGNGGLLTTAEDLLKWNDYYQHAKLGGDALLKKQLATSTLNNGIPHIYAAGLFISKANGLDMITHDGATASYRSNLEYFPQLDLSIAWLSNTSEFDRDPTNIVQALRKLFLPAGNTTSQTSALPQSYSLTADDIKLFVGWYKNNRYGAGLRLYEKDGKIVSSQAGELRPVSATRLAVGASMYELSKEKGKELLFINAQKDSSYFSKVESANMNIEALEEYTGQYYSEEVEARGKISIENGSLVFVQRPGMKLKLVPSFKDGFDGPGSNIYFKRDKGSKIEGFYISIPRARNVWFQLVKK